MAKAKSYTLSQDDFSGGIQERNTSSDSFSERSLSMAKGFVFDDENTLRSQWEVQRVGTRTDFIAVRPFYGTNANYLVAITTGGALVWATAPMDNTSWNSPSLTGLSWFALDGYNYVTNTGVSLTSGLVNLKFIIDNDRIETPGGLRNALTLSNSDGLTSANIASTVTMVKIHQEGEALRGAVFTQKFPKDTLVNAVASPATKQGPPANVGVILGSRLFLGDALYNQNDSTPISETNFMQHKNGAWFSEALTTTFFGLAFLYVGSPAAQIRALHNIDNRIIAITTPGTEGDGLMLVSGDFTGPASAAAANEISGNISFKILRGGVGAPKKTNTIHLNYSTEWEATGSIVFIDARGGVWSTDGSTVNRIDEFGPVTPRAGTEEDHCEAIGDYLFVSRDNRLLLASLLAGTSEDGTSQSCAWTELVTPQTGRVRSLVKLENAVYFIQNGSLYRYLIKGGIRGFVNGTQVDLTLASRTIADGGAGFSKSWLRFGLTMTGAGQVMNVTHRPRAYRSNGTSAFSLAPVDPVVPGVRKTFNLRMGLGTSTEASTELVLRGDLIIDSMEWQVSGVRPER